MPTTTWRGGESVGPRSGGRSGKVRGLDKHAAEAAAGKRPSFERAVIRLVAAFEEQAAKAAAEAATTATMTAATPSPLLVPAPTRQDPSRLAPALSFAAFAALWASSGGAEAFYGGGSGGGTGGGTGGGSGGSGTGPASAAHARAQLAQAMFSAALECLDSPAAALLAEDAEEDEGGGGGGDGGNEGNDGQEEEEAAAGANTAAAAPASAAAVAPPPPPPLPSVPSLACKLGALYAVVSLHATQQHKSSGGSGVGVGDSPRASVYCAPSNLRALAVAVAEAAAAAASSPTENNDAVAALLYLRPHLVAGVARRPPGGGAAATPRAAWAPVSGGSGGGIV